MKRVAVIGASGSGKSTLAAGLADVLGAAHVELDELFHRPNWEPTPTPEFRLTVATALSAATDTGWVVAGNYPVVSDITHGHADTIVWIDLPRWRTVARVLRRSVGRVVRREQLWNGNRETLAHLLSRDPERNPVVHAWRAHALQRRRYEGFIGTPFWEHARVVRLTRPSEVSDFISSAEAAQHLDELG